MNGLPLSKRFPAALLCILIVIFSFAVPAAADPQEKNENNLTVGVPENRCPIFYRDSDTGEPVGIGVDLMRFAAAEAGFDATFQFVREANLKEALDNTDYDVVMPFGSAIKSGSGQASVVSDNLMMTPFTLVTSGKRNVRDFSNARVGMLKSLAGGAETVRQLYPGIQITLYETMDDAVAALRSSEVEALLHNSYVWSYILQKPSYEDLSVQPTSVFSMDFRAGALDTPEGVATIARLNEGISRIGDTREQAIVLDYTSRNLYEYDLYDVIYRFGIYIALTIALFAAVIVISIQRHRTLELRHEERMRRLVDHDELTGALSLAGFRKRAQELLLDNAGEPYVIVYVNIKNFKYVNDSLGMGAGDELLKYLAFRLDSYLGPDDAFCRVAGDHFAILARADGDKSIESLESSVIDSVRNYFTERGRDHRVQVCGGVYVLTPDDYVQPQIDHMLDCARVAEKRVSSTATEGYQFYNPDQWEHERWVSDVVGHLKRALETDEIMVWYQPQVDSETGRVTGAEALCRWNHAKLGWLSPGEFIPALEHAGVITDLDRFVWETVCSDLQRWNQEGRHLSVSVNLSRCDIESGEDIPALFQALVDKYGIGYDQLRIEVTETAFVKDAQLLIQTVARLRELGFEIEMDDFGSGYSSLHMLKEVPVDRIKLDLHFLTGSGDPERGRIIVSFMIGLVEKLGMKIIAEGVETKRQADFLSSHGCTDMQGYYFYRPMPVADFEATVVRIGHGQD